MNNSVFLRGGPMPQKQRGFALFMGLVVLLVLTVLALTSSNVSIMQERMASNVVESNIAFQNAERQLRVLEQRVRQRDFSNAETWDGYGMVDFPSDCSLDLIHGPRWDNWNGNELMVELGDYVNSAGLPAASACRPIAEATRADGTPLEGEYFILAAREFGPGEESRRAEVIVQSIFFWPH